MSELAVTQLPGSERVTPYTNSAAVHPISSLIED